VPLELSVDTSVLVGQRVVVKYLPGAGEYVLYTCIECIAKLPAWLQLYYTKIIGLALTQSGVPAGHCVS